MIEENIVELNIDQLIPNPYQPRKKFNENSLKELALSIKEYGIINPILVRPKDDKYEIIAGERRTRAAKLLNLPKIPAIIKNIDDHKMAEFALIENLQRENISPIEEAMTYQTILNNTNKTEKELSIVIGKSQSFIANKLRLLKLPENIKNALIEKKISERHARSLLTIESEEKQNELLERIIDEKLSVKELDNIINQKALTDAEIHSAVDNIINSLNKSEVKEEEKESDKMNNGNFFPNFNNGNDVNNNQVSLNSMNMQTMNNNFNYQPTEPPVEPIPEPAAPVMPNISEINVQPPVETNTNVVSPAAPEQPNPMVNNDVIQPIPNFNMATPSFEIPVPNYELNSQVTPTEPSQTMVNVPEPPAIEETSPVTDIPLFNSELNQPSAPIVTPEAPTDIASPVTTPIDEPIQVAPLLQPEATPQMTETPVQPMIEEPLFNPELTNSIPETTPQVVESIPDQNSFEVPVTTTSDKFTEITELLNNNGINYKAYSNDSGHCIIIEI